MSVTQPPSREPAVDARGFFTRNWTYFFQQLFEGVGGMASDLLQVSDFRDAQLLEPTGYQLFPGGLIRQWGTATTGANGAVAITFPYEFPTRCVSMKCEGITAAPSGIVFSHAAPGTTGTTVFCSGAGTTNAIKSFDWEAIGY
jgi:hypothetical protein